MMEEKPVTLSEAVRAGKVQATRKLLEGGANPSGHEAGYERYAPLHLACRVGHHTTIVRLLLSHGADVNARNRDGWTPLHYACRHGQTDIVCLLLDAGAEVNAKENNGSTPLSLACLNGHFELTRLLLEKGADVTAKDSRGRSPLSMAAGKLDYKLAHFLISRGADVNAKDKNGETPLHRACRDVRGQRRARRTETVRVLLSHGAEGGAKDNEGFTPLSYVLPLPPDHPAREELIDLFREYAPGAVMAAWCTQETGR